MINTTKAPAAIGPYNQAIQVQNTIYISGQLGIDPRTMQLGECIQKKNTRHVYKT